MVIGNTKSSFIFMPLPLAIYIGPFYNANITTEHMLLPVHVRMRVSTITICRTVIALRWHSFGVIKWRTDKFPRVLIHHRLLLSLTAAL